MLLVVFVSRVNTNTNASVYMDIFSVVYRGQPLVLVYTVEPSDKVFHDQFLGSQ